MALPEKWHPATELDRFGYEVDDLLEHFGFGHRRPKAWESVGLRPALEFFVDDNRLTIRVDLPGIEPEDVDIKVAGGFLTIKGSREEKQNTGCSVSSNTAGPPTTQKNLSYSKAPVVYSVQSETISAVLNINLGDPSG